MSDPGSSKRPLRQRMASLRHAMTANDRTLASVAACARLASLPELLSARVVTAFAPIGTELDPSTAVLAALARGAVVGFPRVGKNRPRMTFHRIADLSELVPGTGSFAIPEPRADAPVVSADTIDFVIVPGLAFDAAGRRLGYGGGYYDEFCAALRAKSSRAPLVGLAFEAQCIPRVPSDTDDITVDLVVTEERVIRCAAARQNTAE